MEVPNDATLLRIFIGYDDVYEDKPLYDQIVLKARSFGLAGATVTRGILGYGAGSAELEIVLRLSEDLPILVEIIDSAERIAAFVPIVQKMIGSGLMLTQPVHVLRYGRKTAT